MNDESVVVEATNVGEKPQFDLEVKANITSVGSIETNIEQIKNCAIRIQDWYKSLVITEDMLKDIKEEKAAVNKAKTLVSDYRKNIVNEFKKPIVAFETMAKETEKILGDTYDCINEQVAKYENETKAAKSEEIKKYFNEYAESLNIDFVAYEQANINVTLAASMKSLRETAKAFLDKVANDLQLIDTQDNKVEILTEYKKTLNVSQAIMSVKQRIEAEARERERQEILAKAKLEQQKQVEKVESVLTAPVEVKEADCGMPPKEEILSMNFKVYGTIDQLRMVKHFLEERGIKYDSNN